jgi:hypothetical protein
MTVGTDRSYHAEREESHGLACSIAASQHPMGTLPHAPRDRAPGQFGAQKERRKRRGWKDKEGRAGSRVAQPRQAGLHRWRNAHSSSRGGDGGGRARRVLFGIPPCAAWTWPGRITIIPCPPSPGVGRRQTWVGAPFPPACRSDFEFGSTTGNSLYHPRCAGRGQSERLQAGFGAGSVASSHLPPSFATLRHSAKSTRSIIRGPPIGTSLGV